jgi:osmotically-inducible protein OsmY
MSGDSQERLRSTAQDKFPGGVKTHMKIRMFTLVATSALALSACAPLLIVGAAGGGRVAAQERSLGRAMDDIGMQTDIEARFASSSLKMFRRVDVRVVEGRVLLAGRVKSEEARVEAGTLAWAVPNVREVNNELIVNSKGGVARDLNDFRISQQLRAKLIADSKISAVNYSLETVDGMVFMIGIARDESELERVALHARTIAGVKKVVSYVQLKDDPSRAQRL